MSNRKKTAIIIPARYASTRFPAKLLADLNGKPVIQWVYEKAMQANADDVWVAADDQRIIDAVESFGGKAVLTSTSHPSGTDRINEAVEIISADNEFDLIVNLQGDEPLISPEVVNQLIDMMLSNDAIKMGTIAVQAQRSEIADDPNRVKAVIAKNGKALYFTRASAPFLRDGGEDCGMFLHWGIYAYKKETLAKLVTFPESKLEKCEKLEQLRALENGIDIFVLKTDKNTIGIDTPEDLEEVKKRLKTINN
jgi:3-deoxy-manno-octulosonate cytidylyltransferase (CMP-KDO synthetase)